MDGRLKGIRFACSPNQLKTPVQYRKGESDLVLRRGKWFLVATCDIPEPEPYAPADWIGVDRGMVNLATTSDGSNYQGRRLGRYRRRQVRKRAELQRKNTSQRCPRCGHTERANRPGRDHFHCRRCGLAGPADVVAGVNVRDRARSAWVFVTAPAPTLSLNQRGLGGCDP
ncbi:zinc ribbon domain-containing protein [Streptomyces sp. NPDC058464]|uniref:zinc ribbon domain-containing protein n=1 Tax=Streptomyces sp. NPDC058464 TaxID=3346511 RepID=UPI0036542A5A